MPESLPADVERVADPPSLWVDDALDVVNGFPLEIAVEPLPVVGVVGVSGDERAS